MPISVVLIAILIGLLTVAASRRSFSAHLNRIEAGLRAIGAGEGPRSDLPAEVLALAVRMGARREGANAVAEFEQSGQMWRAPGGKPMDFTARQTVRIDAPGFLWRATFAPLGVVAVADYLAGATGGLEARLLGAIRLAHMVGGGTIYRGEVLRYLAELPWNPDAILCNRSLDWTVVDPATIRVATGAGEERGEVTFELDSRGLVATARADARPYVEKDRRITQHPWHGRFWDYRPIGGRLMPRAGEVAWTLEAGEFVYWRGQLTRWNGETPTDRQ